MAEWGARFQDAQLEAAYVIRMDAAQVPMDLAMSAIGVMYATVLTRKALEIEGPKTAVVHAVLTALYFLLPLIMIWRDRQAYSAIRQRFAMTWLPSLWYFACRAAEVLNHVPSSSTALPFHFLLRSQLVLLFWANMSIRLPIRCHIIAHGIALLVSMAFNSWRCRWALQVGPWLQEHCRRLVVRLRRVLLVGALGGAPGGEGNECLLLLTFLQLTLGYLLPCYITYRLELNSRRRFLLRQQSHQAQQQGQQQPQPPPRPPPSRSFFNPRLLWHAALVAVVCWHLVEVAVARLPQLH